MSALIITIRHESRTSILIDVTLTNAVIIIIRLESRITMLTMYGNKCAEGVRMTWMFDKI